MTQPVDTKDDPGIFEISGLIAFVWDSRTWVLSGIIAALLGLATIAVARYLSDPPVITYRAAIQMLFPEVQQGNYPNGTAFSLRDVISTEVLQRVYESKKLEGYDLTYEDFVSGVAISPYDPTFEELVDRYREQLSDRRLTLVERTSLEERMSNEMSSRATGKALLSVTLGALSKVPPSVAASLPVEIAKTWQDVALAMLKIYRDGRPSKQADVVDIELLKPSSFPIQVHLIREGISRLRLTIRDLLKMPGTRTIQDPKTGLLLDDVTRRVADIELLEYQKFYGEMLLGKIGPNPEAVLAHLDAGVRLKQSTLTQLRQRADLLDRMIESQRGDTSQQSQAGGTKPSDGVPAQSATTEQKFDADVLDRLLKLARDSELAKFTQGLISDRLSQEEQISNVESELQRQIKDVATLRSLIDQQKADTGPLTDQRKAIIDVAEKLNENSRIASSIADVIRTSTVLGGHRMYRNLLIRQAKIVEIPGVSKITLTLVPVIAFLGAMLGFLAYSFRTAVSRARRRRNAAAAQGAG